MNVPEIRQEHSRDIFSTFLPKKISSGTHEIKIYDHSADPAGGDLTQPFNAGGKICVNLPKHLFQNF